MHGYWYKQKPEKLSGSEYGSQDTQLTAASNKSYREADQGGS